MGGEWGVASGLGRRASGQRAGGLQGVLDIREIGHGVRMRSMVAEAKVRVST